DESAILGWVVFDGRGAVGAGRPLAEVDAVRTPFENAAAYEAAALLEVEAVEQLGIKRPPSGGAEVQVPIDLFFVPLLFGGEPPAHHGLHAGRVSVNGFQLSELAGTGQLTGERKVGQVAALRAGLEDDARPPHVLGQCEALGDVFRARLFA